MFFATLITSIALFFLSTIAAPQSVVLNVDYSIQYDSRNLSLYGVACSNGPNGFITKGYQQLGQLKSYPYAGGTQYIEGWDSDNCGSCYQLTWKTNSVYILGVDHASDGFIISLEAMDALTGGDAIDIGTTQATVVGVANSFCHNE